MAYLRRRELPDKRDETEPPAVAGRSKLPHLRVAWRGRKGRAPSIEDVVGPVLRYGSLASVATILVGLAMLVWFSLADSRGLSDLLASVSRPVALPPAALPSRVWAGDPTAIVSLGLLVLIATPVARVGSTVLYFLWTRDRAYLAITAFVLLVLLAGFGVGSMR